MKIKAHQILNSIALLLAITLLFSLVFGLLYYFAKISTNTFHIMNWISGIIAFGAGGCLLGMHINKKALLHAFIIVVCIAIIMFLLADFSLMNTIEILSKCFAYVVACVIGFNLSHTSQ